MALPEPLRILLLTDSSRGFGRGLMTGISRYSVLHGRWRFYYRQPSYLESKGKVNLEEFERWQPDGVICSIAQAEILKPLAVPMVCYDPGNYDGTIPCIGTDDEAVGDQAARHLLGLGHRHFAFCGFGELRWSAIRRASFCRTIEDSGFQTHLPPSARNHQAWSKEEPALRKWIDQLPKPIGIFCANDDRAASVTEICLSLGLTIPEDVSIIGADNDEMLCEMVNPPLSSVRITSEQAGFEAADLLAKLITRSATLQGQVIQAQAAGVATRQSTNVLMVKNSNLRKAIHFIQQNIARQIRVGDVVTAAGLSHRSLNEQFQKELNSSIGKYLTNARIDHISKLLVDTELRIQEVAYAVGYEDDRHFARYFKRSTGLSPLAFRKRHRAPEL